MQRLVILRCYVDVQNSSNDRKRSYNTNRDIPLTATSPNALDAEAVSHLNQASHKQTIASARSVEAALSSIRHQAHPLRHESGLTDLAVSKLVLRQLILTLHV